MSTMNRGRKRPAPTVCSNNSETNDNLSADDALSLPGTATFDENLSQVSREKRRRRRFSSQRRDEVAKVRKVGACAECRARKVRCFHALQGTDANPVPAPAREPTQKPSPQQYIFPSEPFPEPSYPKAIGEYDAEPGHHPNDMPHQDLPSIDGSDLIDRVRPYTTRKDRLDPYLGDLVNIIGAGSGGSQATNFNGSAWGQNSEWVINATTPMNNQSYSQPFTIYPYSCPNFSTDLGPSLSNPASSNVDLHSKISHHVEQYRCIVRGCEGKHVFQDKIRLRRHQEIEHADLFKPQITYACQVAECKAKRYATSETLHTHIRCNHPEVLGSPTQLPSANTSERDVQPDRLVQVNEFIAEQYAAGMEENTTVGFDHNASGDIEFPVINTWRRAQSCMEPNYPRVQRDYRVRRSNSPMHRQSSTMTIDNPAQILQDHSRVITSNHGIDFANSNTKTSFQKPASRVRHKLRQMKNFVPNQHPRTNSPAPSLSGQFAQRMHISDKPCLYKVPGKIEEDVSDAAIQRDRLQVIDKNNNVPHLTSAALEGEDKSVMSLKRYEPNSYDNFELAHSEVSFSPDYSGSSIGMPALSGGRPSTLLVDSGSSYPPPSLQTDIPNTGYLATEGSSINFSSSAVAAKQPKIILNDEFMLFDDSNEESICPPLNQFSPDPILSQGYTGSNLDYSSMSSSGASGSLLSPVDAYNPFAENYEDWDSSSYIYGHSYIDVNTNDVMM